MLAEEAVTDTIVLDQVNFKYQNKIIFKDLSITFPIGHFSGIIGPSGIGKSTLLNLISSVRYAKDQFSGNISLAGRPIQASQTAYLTQSGTLLPWLTVIENVLLGTKLSWLKQHTKKKREKAHELLHEVGLNHAEKLYPHELSGGMRQRVALARTLLEDKDIILMDEPYSALDAAKRLNLQALTAKLFTNKTVLFITHDPSEAISLAHHIYIMYDSPAKLQLVHTLDGPIPRDVYTETAFKKCKQLLNSLTELEKC